MDPRAELRGLKEIEAACAAFRKLSAVAGSLPQVIREQYPGYSGPASQSSQADRLKALCGQSSFEDAIRMLREAYVAASEFPDYLTLEFLRPQENGSVELQRQTVSFRSDEVQRDFQQVESTLSPLCRDLEAYGKACEKAEDLRIAIKQCPGENRFDQPHVDIDSVYDARDKYAGDVVGKLASAIQGIVSHAAYVAKADGLFGQNGMLAGLEKNWRAVPVEAPRGSGKQRGRKNNGDLSVRVKTAVFALYQETQQISPKVAVARRLGLSKSVLSKPPGNVAYKEAIALLSDAGDKYKVPPNASSQRRLQSDNARKQLL